MNGDLDLHTSPQSEAAPRRQHHCKLQVTVGRHPQAILQAANWDGFTHVDLVVLKRSAIYRKVRTRECVRESRQLVLAYGGDAKEGCTRTGFQQVLECGRDIHSGGDWKLSPRGRNLSG